MQHRIDAMNAYFSARIAECEAHRTALNAEGRGDEAIFEKIRANVFDIFHTVLCVAQNTAGGDEEKVKAFFLSRMVSIPASWQAAKEKAAQHGDEAAALPEEHKLQTARAIREEFLRIWED